VSTPKLSALVVARNEAAQLADCLATLGFADEVVVVLDRTTDASRAVAECLGAKVVEGAWEIEGDRRNAGIEACSGDWILEVDADERAPAALGEEVRTTIATAAPGYFLVPFDNYVGDRLIRHGWGASWGVNSAPRLFSRGAKRWGPQRIHPAVELAGPPRRMKTAMTHLVDRDISDMLARLDRYSTARARDLRAQGRVGTLPGNLRRFVTRFWKCYVSRRGFREGGWGVLIALMAGLYPLLSHLKARLEKD